MTKHFRKFFRQNLVVMLFLSITGIVLFVSIFQQYYHFAYPLVLFLSFCINLLVYYLFTRKPIPANRSMQLLGQSFAIKFFYYLIITFAFLFTLNQKEEKIGFVIALFIIYFAFTIVEVNALTSYVKSESNNS